MVQQSNKKTVTTINDIIIPNIKTRHHYCVLNDDEIAFKCDSSLNNTACYASFYRMENVNFSYDHFNGIKQIILNENNIPPEMFEKSLKEFSGIYNMNYEYDFNNEYNVHYFKLTFEKKPNMGKIRFILDSLRYLWEPDVAVPFDSGALKFNFELTGPEFLSHYYEYIDAYVGTYKGHTQSMRNIHKKLKDINLLLKFVDTYPEGPSSMWLTNVFQREMIRHNIDTSSMIF